MKIIEKNSNFNEKSTIFIKIIYLFITDNQKTII